ERPGQSIGRGGRTGSQTCSRADRIRCTDADASCSGTASVSGTRSLTSAGMGRLWSPWRYEYLRQAHPESGCIFCEKPASGEDERNLILHRGESNFILLNLYPYTSGHLMIAPYAHVATLEEANDEVLAEMMLLARA